MKLDLEERYFSSIWKKFEKSPLEKRTIKHPVHGPRGELEMWVEFLTSKDMSSMIPIAPLQIMEFELRVIVWEAKGFCLKNDFNDCSDVYVRGCYLQDVQETDTHFFARKNAHFNFRMLFDINLPIDQNTNYGGNLFILGLWNTN